jgi:integrase
MPHDPDLLTLAQAVLRKQRDSAWDSRGTPALAAGPCGDLAFIAGSDDKPMTKEGFGNAFRNACRAAGVPGSAHGLRKIAATRAANAGATVAELEAIFGWTGGRMASLYTRAANRRLLARRAMHKLA